MKAIVRFLRWGVADLDAGIAARMWFGALFGPVLIIVGGTLIGSGAREGGLVLVSGIVITIIGLAYVIGVRVAAARKRRDRAQMR